MSNVTNWIAKKEINTAYVNVLLTNSLAKNQFTNYGPNVIKLEEWIYDNLEIDRTQYGVIAVCNASAGLQCLVDAIQYYNDTDNPVQQHKPWATQAFTFPPSAQGTLKTALIIDIDSDGGLDLNLINPADITGIIVTNVFGNVVDIDKYISWSNKYNLPVVFDNAATPYTFYKGENACNYGHGSIISFHHTKPLGFGEGGAVIIRREYVEFARRLINFGIDNELRLPWLRIGSNYKMSEIGAIYILQYLESYFEKIKIHHTIMYIKAIEYAGTNNVRLFPNYADLSKPIITSCICFLDDKFNEDYITAMITSGIICRKYYHPLANLPQATAIYSNIICYPCNLDVNSYHLL